MSVEEILKVLKSHPEVIVEALESKPELLAGIVLKLAPWDRFATKEDIRMILDFMEKRFGDINSRFGDMNRRFEDINNRFEDINSRFEEINKRFEDINSRFESIDRRFEDVNRRFEDMNKRFEDLRYYIDKRVGLVEKLLLGFNIPILIAIITILIRLFIT